MYDSTVELTVAPTSLRKGDAGLFIVSAYVTHPSVYVEFGVFQPLGYNVGPRRSRCAKFQ